MPSLHPTSSGKSCLRSPREMGREKFESSSAKEMPGKLSEKVLERPEFLRVEHTNSSPDCHMECRWFQCTWEVNHYMIIVSISNPHDLTQPHNM